AGDRRVKAHRPLLATLSGFPREEREPDRRTALRSALHPILHPYPPTVALDEHAADIEPKPCSGHHALPPLETVEELNLHRVGDPRPGVLDRDHHFLPALLDPDSYLHIRPPELPGVTKQV